MKNKEAITIHLPDETKIKTQLIAEMHGYKHVSQYVRFLIENDLEANKATFERMKTIFGE